MRQKQRLSKEETVPLAGTRAPKLEREEGENYKQEKRNEGPVVYSGEKKK